MKYNQCESYDTKDGIIVIVIPSVKERYWRREGMITNEWGQSCHGFIVRAFFSFFFWVGLGRIHWLGICLDGKAKFTFQQVY